MGKPKRCCWPLLLCKGRMRNDIWIRFKKTRNPNNKYAGFNNVESQYFRIVSIWGFETLLNWAILAIPLVGLYLSTSGLVQRPNYSFPWEDFSYLLNLLNAKIWGNIKCKNKIWGKPPFVFHNSAPEWLSKAVKMCFFCKSCIFCGIDALHISISWLFFVVDASVIVIDC